MALPIIDARVHIARGISPWSEAREVLRRAGVDTAMLTAHPESTQLDDDISLPLSAAGQDGPYAAYYVGGDPYEGYRRGRISVPSDLGRWDAVHIRCFLSPSLDFGGATTAAQWEPDRLREAVERQDLGELLDAAAQREMPVWLTEHFPVTLELIERHPDVRFVIPKMGAMNGGTAQVLNTLAPYTHICFDTSCGELQESIVERIGYRRILFASGYPFNQPSDALDQLGALKLSDDEIGAIAGGNFLELIGA